MRPCCSLKHHTGALHPANLGASGVLHPLFSPRTVADLHSIAFCGTHRVDTVPGSGLLGLRLLPY
jgi:hypothetical protein